MCKSQEEQKDISFKFDKKTFKENFIKGDIYHGILINSKEISKIKSIELYYLNSFIIKINYFLLYMIMQIYIIILLKIKKLWK